MATSERIIANNVVFKLPTTDYAGDLNSIEFVTEDAPGGVRTFGDFQTEQMWKATLSGITSGESTSLFRVLMAAYGDELAFEVAPQGGSAATDAPHYEGTLMIDALPPISLTAGDTAQFSITLSVKNTTHDPASGIFWGLSVVTA